MFWFAVFNYFWLSLFVILTFTNFNRFLSSISYNVIITFASSFLDRRFTWGPKIFLLFSCLYVFTSCVLISFLWGGCSRCDGNGHIYTYTCYYAKVGMLYTSTWLHSMLSIYYSYIYSIYINKKQWLCVCERV